MVRISPVAGLRTTTAALSTSCATARAATHARASVSASRCRCQVEAGGDLPAAAGDRIGTVARLQLLLHVEHEVGRLQHRAAGGLVRRQQRRQGDGFPWAT